MLKMGSLVDYKFEKNKMKYDRYKQSEEDYVHGLGCIVGGPFELPHAKLIAYEVFFQKNKRSCRIPERLLALVK